jgi:AraC family transcriptional activator of pobA
MPSRRSNRSTDLRTFTLYGEGQSVQVPALHVESIQSRSSRYDWEIQAHVHQGLHQVIWIASGPGEVILDESRSSCEGPAALVIPPGVAHAFRFTSLTDGQVLTFSAAALAEGEGGGVGEALQTLFSQPRTLHPESSEAERLAALFSTLQAEADSADRDPDLNHANPVPLWLARAVVWRLAQSARQADLPPARTGSGQRALYTRWVVLVERHYREHWPVSRYAERLGLSEERLNRMVKAETGLTAQAVLHARLTREACRRLVHVAAPVSHLAFELGFEDPAYFCRFFKRQTGLSPRTYRLQMTPAA